MREITRLILEEEDKKVITDFLELLCKVTVKANKYSKNILDYFEKNAEVEFNNVKREFEDGVSIDVLDSKRPYICTLNIDEIDFDEIKDEW